jgi:hypothetical protein
VNLCLIFLSRPENLTSLRGLESDIAQRLSFDLDILPFIDVAAILAEPTN